jgi:hypothetical protein
MAIVLIKRYGDVIAKVCIFYKLPEESIEYKFLEYFSLSDASDNEWIWKTDRDS